MDISTDYPFLIAIYLIVGLITHNVTNSLPFMPGRCAKFGWTWYGIFVAIGLFLSLLLISRCGINMILATLIFIIPTVLRYLLCRKCERVYNVTLTYLGIIPLILYLFKCPEVAVLCTAIAIASAFGRLGCISAGCCYGPETQCDKFHYTYHDKMQLVNVHNNNSDFTCSVPTLHYETICQFIIAGLCLRYPSYSPLIFGIGTSLVVFLTDYWRQRVWTKLTALILLLIPLICVGNVGSVCQSTVQPKIVLSALIALASGYVLSNDMIKPTG